MECPPLLKKSGPEWDKKVKELLSLLSFFYAMLKYFDNSNENSKTTILRKPIYFPYKFKTFDFFSNI